MSRARFLSGRTQAARARRLLPLLLAAVLVFQTGCRAQQPWPLWEKYSERFIDQQGRVIDHTAGDRTTSEGQAYALFFALVSNDKPRFTKILAWTEANLADGDLTLRLPAWQWGKSPEGTWKVLDPNPASDADLWMAYCLLEGGRLWHDTRFEKLGALMVSRLAQQEVALVPGVGTTLLPGPQGFHPGPDTWILNPSYLPLPLLTFFAKTAPEGPWSRVIESLHVLLAQGSGAGYVMDWVSAGAGIHPSLAPAVLATGKTDGTEAVGSFDAIRVYLWLGLSDPATPGLHDLLAGTAGMSNLMRTAVTPPMIVGATGRVINPDGPSGFSAALIPYLSMLNQKQQAKLQEDRLLATKDPATGLYGRDPAYYDQNLALFATGWSEGRFRFDRDGKLKVKWR